MKPHNGPIRWGIAGTGGIAGAFANDAARVTDMVLAGVASRSAERADAFAASHGVERAHESYEALAADPSIDAVYVAGIHPVHMPHTVMFLEAGKHVLVEKPIALNAAEVDSMVAAAERNDRFLMEAMWMRFNPTHVEVMNRIASGAIGEVRRITADFSFALAPDPEHRLWNREMGGGALLDLGIYPFSLAWWVLGPPAEITASGHLSETGVDDEVNLFCTWADGATAVATAGIRLPGPMTARIEGTNGTVEFPAPGHAADRATLRQGPETEEISSGAGGLHHQVREVHRCLRAGACESDRMPWATSRAIMERFDTIRTELGVTYPADG